MHKFDGKKKNFEVHAYVTDIGHIVTRNIYLDNIGRTERNAVLGLPKKIKCTSLKL